ncbi:Sec-independent protein translocase protein TatB [Sulfurimonas autotrophica]|uniref:Sec-independent protein translocase protein TatB homolog n=1 Tax=Sulfurimonas autotrophica (strain ATCC BAA-671 / DSM 16294 / JCM 11897 / OK10) TaxID=563040 RepID=E0UPU0_SULAO|nr:Sec-independent protein translocase protein TatB [Sulfurimonas autotrophica]ADN09749.1 twin-arginine translocation protein, TatB subunit [Sulfurimonas autotrophica DSM 16294]
MFGMGFTEMLLIAVIAILFLGPDKLPSTMIEIAKFFKNVKSTIGNVKDSLEEEMNLSEIKQEALAYKQELLNASESLHKVTDIPAEAGAKLTSLTDDILADDDAKKEPKKESKEPQEVTFKKKPKEEKIDKKEEENKDV